MVEVFYSLFSSYTTNCSNCKFVDFALLEHINRSHKLFLKNYLKNVWGKIIADLIILINIFFHDFFCFILVGLG